MQRGFLLVALATLPLLMAPPVGGSPLWGDDCQNNIVHMERLPGPSPPSPPVRIYPIAGPCIDRLKPPMPEPGEEPVEYGERVISYYVCMDPNQTPPGVIVSEQCGPPTTWLPYMLP